MTKQQYEWEDALTECYRDLCNAVVAEAVRSYRETFRRRRGEKERCEWEELFASKYFESWTKMDRDYFNKVVVSRVRREEYSRMFAKAEAKNDTKEMKRIKEILDTVA